MIALFFDTETTGIKSKKNPGFVPALVQLGAILQDLDTGRVLAEINLIVDSHQPIPPEASAVHGITEDLADKYGVTKNMADSVFLHLIMSADMVVAHNIEYDLDIIKDNLPASHLQIATKYDFDTMLASVYIVRAPLTPRQLEYKELQEFPFKVPNMMETYTHFFGHGFDGAHDAMADIRACRDVFQELITEGWYRVENLQVFRTEKLDALKAEFAEVKNG